MAQYNDRLMCIQGQNKNGGGYVNLDSLYEAQTNVEADNLSKLQGINNKQQHSTKFIRVMMDNFEDILIYPNPASDELFISSVSENGEFVLTDMFGKVVLKQKIFASKANQKIKLPLLSNGLYTYRINLISEFYGGKINILQNEK